MTTTKAYKYEVAFSFLKQDEALAYEINNLVRERLTTFIYSKKQEELGGTDGEQKFTEVFNKESRVVVVLYRQGWGQTPWTRIEELAIKNRAFDTGWDFLLLINLDTKAPLPAWIPKTYLWFDISRYKAVGAAAIIERKITEEGGEVRPETVADVAERHKRQRMAEQAREEFLNSNELRQIANQEVIKIIDKLHAHKDEIEDPSTFFHLAWEERRHEMYEFGYGGYYLCFNWSGRHAIDMRNANLRVALYEKSGHYHINYEEKVIRQTDYKIDRDLSENLGWSDFSTGLNFLTSDELIDKWVKMFIDGLGKRKKKNVR